MTVSFFCELDGILLQHLGNARREDIGVDCDEGHMDICISYNGVLVRVYHEMGYRQKVHNVHNAWLISHLHLIE